MSGRVKHNLSRTPAYRAWAAMRHRCLNPASKQYGRYGGRGIKIDPSWVSDVARFVEDMGQPPGEGFSLDRIDNDSDYCKENCRWATVMEQNRNRSVCRHLTFNGISKTVQEWADEYGVKYTTLMRRVFEWGWSAEKALTTSVKDWREARKRNEKGQYA